MKRALPVAACLFAGLASAQVPPRLEEVEVTAQRRTESVQRAAVAVSVLTPDDLRNAGVTKPQELTELVPSLQVAASAAPISVYYLRGAGNFTGNALTDSAVAFNVDGVFIGRPHSTAGFFYDLERIEILKGPQGTLYGRNATGGAINVLPRRPDLGAWSGEASAEFGNEDQLRFDGTLNVPLGDGDRAAIRAAAFHVEHDGFMNDGLDNQDDSAARLSFLAEPSDALSIRVVADYFDQGGLGTGSTPIVLGPDNRYGISSAESGAFLETQRNCIAGRNFNPMPPTQKLDNYYWGVNATLDWETAGGTFTLLPAYRESHLDTVGTALAVNVTTVEDDEQTSLEARFASNLEGKLSYIVGAYWFDETNRMPLFVPNTQYTMAIQDYDTGVESAAAFGRVTYELTDSVRATVGARYTEEDKFFRGTFDSFVRRCLPSGGGLSGCRAHSRHAADACSARSGGGWHDHGAVPHRQRRDRVLLQVDLARRARLGSHGRQLPVRQLRDRLQVRRVLLLERLAGVPAGGARGLHRWARGTACSTAACRSTSRRSTGATMTSRSARSCATRRMPRTSARATSATATMQGIEIETAWLVTDATMLSLDAQYLDATYDDFHYTVPGPGAPPVSGCAVSPDGVNFAVDCSGKRMPYAPEWTVNLGGEHSFRLGNDARLVAGLRLHYQSEMLTGLDFTPLEYQDDYVTVGASLTWNSPDTRYYVVAFGNNLTDETVVANSFQPPFGSFVVGTLRPPRTYGLRMGARF